MRFTNVNIGYTISVWPGSPERVLKMLQDNFMLKDEMLDYFAMWPAEDDAYTVKTLVMSQAGDVVIAAAASITGTDFSEDNARQMLINDTDYDILEMASLLLQEGGVLIDPRML